MATKGKASEVGAEQPTEKSMGNIEDLVSNVLDAPAPAPKSTLEKKEEEGLEEEASTQDLAEETKEETSNEAGEQAEETAHDAGDSEDSEDVVPASKHKKALEKMQKRINDLTQKVRSQEAAEMGKEKTQDERLESLSVVELNELRDNVDESIMDAKVASRVDGTDNTDRIQELRNLKRSIDRTIKSVPERFQSKQLAHLEDMIQVVKEVDPAVEGKAGELWNTAIRIYQKMPSLQRSETGQAEALATAAEYYLERQSQGADRERASTLSQKVSSLKKKTSLDGKTRQANVEQVSSKKAKEKAVQGTYYDKLDFIKTLVPDDFLSPGAQ